MQIDMTRPDGSFVPSTSRVTGGNAASDETLAYERAVDAILDDCFLAIGQAVGLRATLDFAAVCYIRDHFRVRFLAAMQHFGNRWLDDRSTVTAVAAMLGERAVRYANGAEVIDVEAVRQASADVQRYCQLHAGRRHRRRQRPGHRSRHGADRRLLVHVGSEGIVGTRAWLFE